MVNFIPYGRQWLDDDDIKQVTHTLRGDYLTTGPQVEAFEKALCEYLGVEYCVVVSSGTAALYLTVQALDIEPGMEGITSPNTFVASANCMVHNDITPRFADIDNDTFNISPEEIEKNITAKTRLIIPVHFAGRPALMDQISSIARKNNCHVIEDAAHAIGSCYPSGEKVGCCKFSEATIFSFHPVKTITTGEGGAITTNSKTLYKRLCRLRSHGIVRDKDLANESPGMWYYEQQEFGYNYRISDFQCSLGISQLKKIDIFMKRRQHIISEYNDAFKNLDVLKTPAVSNSKVCFHLYVVRIDFSRLNVNRNAFMELLRQKNIGTQVLYIPVPAQPYFKDKYGYSGEMVPNALSYYSEALALPLYPKMTDTEINYVSETVQTLLKQHVKI